MTTFVHNIPTTSRPLELAGPGERPAASNMQEITHMPDSNVTAQVTSAPPLSGAVDFAQRLDDRDAAFQHAAFCDHPNMAHSCTGSAPMLSGARFSVTETPAEIVAYPWAEERDHEQSVAVVIEHPYVDDGPQPDSLAEFWLEPKTARALAAQLLDAARQAEADRAAIVESDHQLTALSVLFQRVACGDFAELAEVRAEARRIVGVA